MTDFYVIITTFLKIIICCAAS